MPCFIATNSAPNMLLVSIVDCFFECQTIGAILRYIKNPVHDHHVSLSPAWSELTNIRRSTSFPLSGGALAGRNCFLHFTIELFPITLLENSKFNIQIHWIIYDISIVLLLKISKQLEQHIQMSLSWQC